jgi:hypothetical protein
MNGDSTWQAPNFIKIKKLATNAQKAILLKGLNWKPFVLPKSAKGNNIILNIAANIAITPNNLLGIDLNIA